MSASLKKQVHQSIITRLTEQLAELDAAMEKVRESIEGEDKSSAGDKFETARAIAQTEMERLAMQQNKVRTDLGTLKLVDPERKLEHVQIGSLVVTDHKILFMAVAMGKLELKGKTVFVVSPTSPIGQQIIGKSKGFEFQVGPQADRIKSVF